MLACLAIPAFAQTDDPYAKFQGSWYGAIDDEPIFYIFTNDDFTVIRQDSEMIGMIVGKFSISEKKLNLETTKYIVGEKGFYLPYEDGVQNIQMQYIISDGNLVLIDNTDGSIITYLKKIE
jgi:hypothetical protein